PDEDNVNRPVRKSTRGRKVTKRKQGDDDEDALGEDLVKKPRAATSQVGKDNGQPSEYRRSARDPGKRKQANEDQEEPTIPENPREANEDVAEDPEEQTGAAKGPKKKVPCKSCINLQEQLAQRDAASVGWEKKCKSAEKKCRDLEKRIEELDKKVARLHEHISNTQIVLEAYKKREDEQGRAKAVEADKAKKGKEPADQADGAEEGRGWGDATGGGPTEGRGT
ncbi:hypothetical protein HDU96_003927, partial [Phlyctochytrium bullatum]